MNEIIVRKYQTLKPELNERQHRLWAASESQCLGYGAGLAYPEIKSMNDAHHLEKGCPILPLTMS